MLQKKFLQTSESSNFNGWKADRDCCRASKSQSTSREKCPNLRLLQACLERFCKILSEQQQVHLSGPVPLQTPPKAILDQRLREVPELSNFRHLIWKHWSTGLGQGTQIWASCGAPAAGQTAASPTPQPRFVSRCFAFPFSLPGVFSTSMLKISACSRIPACFRINYDRSVSMEDVPCQKYYLICKHFMIFKKL